MGSFRDPGKRDLDTAENRSMNTMNHKEGKTEQTKQNIVEMDEPARGILNMLTTGACHAPGMQA